MAQDKSTPGQVIYPVAVVEVNGFKCRPLLDTGASFIRVVGSPSPSWHHDQFEKNSSI